MRSSLPRNFPYFYGWAMLPVAMASMICTSPGQTYIVSTFYLSFQNALNLTNQQITGAYMLGTILAAAPMVYVGSLMDRHGIRRTMIGVVLLLGFVCAAVSQVSSLTTLFLAFFLLRLLGQGSLTLLSSNVLAFWFHNHLGKASGIKSVGMACSIAFLPGISLWLIGTYGWQTTYIIFGGAIWAVMFPLLLIVSRDKPEEVGQIRDGINASDQQTEVQENKPESESDVNNSDWTLGEALKTRTFWFVALPVAVWAMAGTGITFSLLKLFNDNHLTGDLLGYKWVTFGVTLGFMQLIGGSLADRIPLNLLMGIAFSLFAGSTFLLLQLEHWWIMHVYAFCSGTAHAFLAASGNTLWVRYYGRTHIGKIRGLIWSITVAASSIGPFIMGWFRDTDGNYDSAIMLFGCLYCPMILLGLLALPPKRKTNTTD